jgi:CubicO group peptidase (beta-lactamase class C family)
MAIRARLLILLLISSISLYGQNRQAALANYFLALAQNQEFNGNVLIAENGKVIFSSSYGYADFGQKRKNTKASVFPIMSITKTFTATAILQLQEQGKLKVTDPVIKYLPRFPYPNITIRHLLSHTSGLPSYDQLFDSLRLTHPDTIFTNKDILPRYAQLKVPLKYQPGENGNYDNINYIFLAIIVEKVSGVPFKDYIRGHIFKPAGMSHTFFPAISFYYHTSREKKNLSFMYSYPHSYSEKPAQTDTIAYFKKYGANYNLNGAGEINATLEDLLKYDQALYTGKLLSQATLKEAFTPVYLKNGKINPVTNGLGWQVLKDSTFGKTVAHGGGAKGLSSTLTRDIDRHQTIIIIDNLHSQAGIFVNAIAADALKILNGQVVELPRKSIARSFGQTLVNGGILQAKAKLEMLQEDSLNYKLNEVELNALGYELMNAGKMHESLEALKFNSQLFPNSWNTYDSYGEILAKTGNKREAISMYKKSLELNPKNIGGAEQLKKLLAE